jgi:hypothetical protein
MWLLATTHHITKKPYSTTSPEIRCAGKRIGHPFRRANHQMIKATAIISNPTLNLFTSHHSMKSILSNRPSFRQEKQEFPGGLNNYITAGFQEILSFSDLRIKSMLGGRIPY